MSCCSRCQSSGTSEQNYIQNWLLKMGTRFQSWLDSHISSSSRTSYTPQKIFTGMDTTYRRQWIYYWLFHCYCLLAYLASSVNMGQLDFSFLRKKLPLNYLVVNTSSYHNGADVTNQYLYAVVSYSCPHSQNDVPPIRHVRLFLSLASDLSFSRDTITLMTYSKDIFSFRGSGLRFLFVYVVHLPLHLRWFIHWRRRGELDLFFSVVEPASEQRWCCYSC